MKNTANLNPSGYSPQLDGLRAFCIIFTIFNHIEGVPSWINGGVGVDVFFVLSGFLITGILIQGEGRKNFLKSFYIRRFFRIAPIYYFSFALTALAALILDRKFGSSTKINELAASWQYIILFLGEYRPATAGSFFGHSWTIGIEEKFYLIWPILFIFLLGNAISRVVFLCLFLVLIGNLGDMELRGYGGIAMGSIAATFIFHWKIKSVNTYFAFSMFVSAYIIQIFSPDFIFSISVAAAFLVPALYQNNCSLIAKILALPLFVWLGRLTFSIYMLHILCLNVVKIFFAKIEVDNWLIVFWVGYVLSVVVAWLSFRLIEYPLIVYGKRLAYTKTAVLA